MELRERVELLTKPARSNLSYQSNNKTSPYDNSKYVKRIVFLEKQSEKGRQLRLLLCVHAIIAVLLAEFDITTRPNLNTFVHIVLFINSLLAEACIFFIYYIKARFAGITNASVGAHKRVNLFHSPYVWQMIGEVVIWLLQCPPWIQRPATVHALDCLVLLRLYVGAIALSHYLSSSLFSRALAALCKYRSHTAYILRAGFMQHHALIWLSGVAVVWVSLSLLYMKCESVRWNDALYFVMNTAGLIGAGDVEPITLPGRFIAVLSYLLGLAIVAISVGMMQTFLTMSEAERNLFALFKVNSYIGKIPDEAARVIQRSWKLYSAKTEMRNPLSVQFNALLLSHQASYFRELRRAFTMTEIEFLRSAALMQERTLNNDAANKTNTSCCSSLSASMMSRSISSVTTPRSPRSRRPFAPLQQVKVKPSSAQSSPRLGTLQVRTFEKLTQNRSEEVRRTLPVEKGTDEECHSSLEKSTQRCNKSYSPDDSSKKDNERLVNEATEVAERLVELENTIDTMMRKLERVAAVMNVSSTELNS